MKKLIIISALIGCSYAKATVITVSNNPITAGQYTDLAAAYTAASVGDTLYVMGSPNTYCPSGLTINKRITIIGAGYNDSAFFLNTIIGGITLDTNTSGSTSASGTYISGINCGSISFNNPVQNITINRCLFNTLTLGGNGWVIQNCICTSQIIFMYTSISSCLIENSFLSNMVAFYTTDLSGLLVNHNIITGAIYQIYIGSMSYATISNNIFFAEDFSAFNVSYCNFINNMDFNDTSGVFPSGTNYGSGNFSETFSSPQFDNSLTAVSGLTDILSNDWHLLSSSAGHNAASDGTDLGVYGGFYPMVDFTGNTSLPQLTLMGINTPSIAVDSPLNVHFKARVHN